MRRGRAHVQGTEVETEGPVKSVEKSGALEGGGPAPDDAVNLQRRVGLLSGVALIVGTMIGKRKMSSFPTALHKTHSHKRICPSAILNSNFSLYNHFKILKLPFFPREKSSHKFQALWESLWFRKALYTYLIG